MWILTDRNTYMHPFSVYHVIRSWVGGQSEFKVTAGMGKDARLISPVPKIFMRWLLYPIFPYSKCHVTSNKAKSNLECAEEKFQTRGWVRYTVPCWWYLLGFTNYTTKHNRPLWVAVQGLIRPTPYTYIQLHHSSVCILLLPTLLVGTIISLYTKYRPPDVLSQSGLWTSSLLEGFLLTNWLLVACSFFTIYSSYSLAMCDWFCATAPVAVKIHPKVAFVGLDRGHLAPPFIYALSRVGYLGIVCSSNRCLYSDGFAVFVTTDISLRRCVVMGSYFREICWIDMTVWVSWARHNTYGFSIGRTSVKKLLPPQAMHGLLLGMRGLVPSYVTLAIIYLSWLFNGTISTEII
jgi:hypothetical protein